MTEQEKIEQAMGFAYGNLALSTNHRPKREIFRSIALDRGWTEEQFNDWAKDREWY